MLDLIAATALPIALAVCAGWVLGRWRSIAAAPLATVGVEVFGPALVLAQIPRDLARQGPVFLLLIFVSALLIAIGWLAARLLGIEDADERTGFICAVAFANFGFIGLPLVEYMLGAAAMPTAITALAFLNIPTGIVAVVLTSPEGSLKGALRRTARVPFTWAVVAALTLGWAGILLPLPLQRPLELLAHGTVPLFLVVLGLQLAQFRPGPARAVDLLAVLALRLIVSPFLTWALAPYCGVDPNGIVGRTLFVQMATPPGLTPLLFMAAFGRDPSFLATAVLAGSLASIVSAPLLYRLFF